MQRPRIGRGRGLALGGALLALGCGADPVVCEQQELADLASPDARHRAVLFTRDCGALQGVSTHVSVLAPEAPLPDAPGNTFVAASGVAVSVAWPAANRLTITRPENAPVEIANARVAEVEVEYQTEFSAP